MECVNRGTRASGGSRSKLEIQYMEGRGTLGFTHAALVAYGFENQSRSEL